jgi:hypothetical protein
MAFHKLTLAFAFLLFALVTDAVADDAAVEAEIGFLIEAIGDSGCTFVRNGKPHSARDAEEHIRMKYRRGKRYASTAELFIERLASKSSMSRKSYWMECPGNEPVRSGDWLKSELKRYRENREQSGA